MELLQNQLEWVQKLNVVFFAMRSKPRISLQYTTMACKHNTHSVSNNSHLSNQYMLELSFTKTKGNIAMPIADSATRLWCCLLMKIHIECFSVQLLFSSRNYRRSVCASPWPAIASYSFAREPHKTCTPAQRRIGSMWNVLGAPFQLLAVACSINKIFQTFRTTTGFSLVGFLGFCLSYPFTVFSWCN